MLASLFVWPGSEVAERPDGVFHAADVAIDKGPDVNIKTFMPKAAGVLRCTPAQAVRRLIVLAGAIAAASPAWKLALAMLTVLSSVISITLVVGMTAGALWLTSNWRRVINGFTNSVSDTVGDLFGKEPS